MTEQAPVQSETAPNIETLPPSTGLKARLAVGEFYPVDQTHGVDINLISNLTEVDPRTFNAIKNQNNARREADAEAFAQKLQKEGINDPSIIRRRQMNEWARGSLGEIIKIIQTGQPGEQTTQRTSDIAHALDKLGISHNHPEEAMRSFYDDQTQQEGTFYQRFCTSHANLPQELAKALSRHEMFLLRPFITKWVLGDSESFDALIALKDTMDAVTQAQNDNQIRNNLQNHVNDASLSDRDQRILQYYREGAEMQNGTIRKGQSARLAHSPARSADTSPSFHDENIASDINFEQLGESFSLDAANPPLPEILQIYGNYGNVFNEHDSPTVAGRAIAKVYSELVARDAQSPISVNQANKQGGEARTDYKSYVQSKLTERENIGDNRITAGNNRVSGTDQFHLNGETLLSAPHEFYFNKSGYHYRQENRGENAKDVRAYITLSPTEATNIQRLFVDLSLNLYDAGIDFTAKAASPYGVETRTDNMVFYIAQNDQAKAADLIKQFLNDRRLGQGHVRAAIPDEQNGLSWAMNPTAAEQAVWERVSGSTANVSFNEFVATMAIPTYLDRLVQAHASNGNMQAAQIYRQEAQRVKTIIENYDRSVSQEKDKQTTTEHYDPRVLAATAEAQQLRSTLIRNNTPDSILIPENPTFTHRTSDEKAVLSIFRNGLYNHAPNFNGTAIPLLGTHGQESIQQIKEGNANIIAQRHYDSRFVVIMTFPKTPPADVQERYNQAIRNPFLRKADIYDFYQISTAGSAHTIPPQYLTGVVDQYTGKYYTKEEFITQFSST